MNIINQFIFASHVHGLITFLLFTKIKWKNRFRRPPSTVGLNSCLVTVDGTDFPIVEPWPFKLDFNRKFYSYKFKRSGLWYKVAIAVYKGNIVWFHGPFPCGAFNDVKIFSLKLQTMLLYCEKVITDRGYKGNPFCMTPDDSWNEEQTKFMAKARARHETINRRLKQWGCLKQLWRHDCKNTI